MEQNSTTDMIRVVLNKDRIVEVKQGTAILDIVEQYVEHAAAPILAARVDNEIRELNYTLDQDCSLRFVDLTDEDGGRIYLRSLFFVMLKAVEELYPGARVVAHNTISKGLYCEINNIGEIGKNHVRNIHRRMKEIINFRIPFVKSVVPAEDAKRMYAEEGMLDKVSLIEYRKKPTVSFYTCGGTRDYFYGYMIPHTGYIHLFELRFHPPGVLLRYPDKSNPYAVPKFKESKKLFHIFHEYKHWNSVLEVENVGMLDDIIKTGSVDDFIRISEALHEKKTAQIADIIASDKGKKLVLIAGPSSSGKTTFSQRLAIQLRVNGLKPLTISLDNYFVDREHTPLDENGNYDFESLETVDIALFNQHLNALINGEAIEIPLFDFLKGKRKTAGIKVRMNPDQILIIEGIHGLNEKLTGAIARNLKYKIYVSALASLNIDDHNRIPTTDTRIIRRIVRDNKYRGHDALRTIQLWPSVRKGEDKNIFPFQEEADVMFNSALVYELSVLKQFAEPLLSKIDKSCEEYSEAKRLLEFLTYFLPVYTKDIPANSIIREFIGGGCFYR